MTPQPVASGKWQVARVEFRVGAGFRVRVGVGVRVRAGVRVRVRAGLGLVLGLG